MSLFLYSALDSQLFLPPRTASGRCFLSAAAACAPAGVVFAFAEPSSCRYPPPPPTAHLWDSRPQSSQTGQVIQGLCWHDQNTFGPTEGQIVQWREANRHRQRQINLTPWPHANPQRPATVSLTASASFNGMCNRPQPLWQPPPTACLTASGAAAEALSFLMHPWRGVVWNPGPGAICALVLTHRSAAP